MWLNDLTREEQTVLTAMAALAASLPRQLVDYSEALADINRKFFGQPTPKRPQDHNPLPGSLSRSRSIAASPRYGSGR